MDKDTQANYDDIFKTLVRSAYQGNMEEEIKNLQQKGGEETDLYIRYATGGGDPNRVVFKVRDCTGHCTLDKDDDCEANCLFGAIVRDMEGNVVIKQNNCTGCGQCV